MVGQYIYKYVVVVAVREGSERLNLLVGGKRCCWVMFLSCPQYSTIFIQILIRKLLNIENNLKT
jgi:hypothetical protein